MTVNIGTLTAYIEADTRGFHSGFASAERSMRNFEQRSLTASRGFTTAVTGMTSSVARLSGALAGIGITAGFVAMGKAATRVGMNLETALTSTFGVMRATGEQMGGLTAMAKHMGETTEYTAAQAAGALKFLGMAGFEAGQAMKALPGVLDLATAGELDLARSADIASNALTAMNLPVGQLNRVNDVFVATITRSNTNIEQMAEAFKYSAPVARAFGYSIEELSALIGKLGDSGIQSSMSGTQLAMAIQKADEYAGKMGLSSGNLLDVLDHLKQTGATNADIMDVFSERAGRAALVLMDVTDATRKFTTTLENAGGESSRLASTMRSTVGMQFKTLASTIESVAVDAFEIYKDELRGILQSTIATVRAVKPAILGFVGVVSYGMSTIGGAVNLGANLLGGFIDRFRSIDEARPTVDQLATSFTDLTARVEEATAAFEEQKISVGELRSTLDDVLSGNIASATEGLASNILAAADSEKEALQMLWATFLGADNIPLNELAKIEGAIVRHFNDLREKARIAQYEVITDWEQFFKDILASRVVMDTSGAARQIQETLAGLIAQGFRIPTDPQGIENLLTGFGFTSEQIADALGDRFSTALAKAEGKVASALAGKNLSGGGMARISVPVEFDLKMIETTGTPGLDSNIAVHEEYLNQWESSTRERLSGMKNLEQAHFQARLSLADEFGRQRLQIDQDYQQQMMEIDRWYEEQKQLFGDEGLALYGQVEAAKASLYQSYAERRREIDRQEHESRIAQWQNEHAIMIESIDQFTNYWIESAFRGGGTWREVLSQVGEYAYRAFAGRALDALWKWIAGQKVSQMASSAGSSAKAAETAATSALTAATTALTGASAAATAAQTVELGIVKTLTQGYISLAAAKAAASLGATSGASIAAAATVKGTLTPMLTGFDDPVNDAVARRHGWDYMNEFMAGAKSRVPAPGFGIEIQGVLDRAAQPTGESQSAPTAPQQITIYHEYNGVVSEDFQDATIRATERASYRRKVALKAVEDDIFGGSRVLGVR